MKKSMTGLGLCGSEFAAMCLVSALRSITVHQLGWSLAWRTGGKKSGRVKINWNLLTPRCLSLTTANGDLENVMAVASLYVVYFQSTPTLEIKETVQERKIQKCSSQNNQVHK